MGSLKPKVGHDEVASLLDQQFGEPVRRLQPMAGGSVAQTFSFLVGTQEYVIRFNQHMGANFEKEAPISRTIASPRIPIPPIVRIGRLRDLHYAISLKVPGTGLDNLTAGDISALLPAIVETLDAIHAVDVSATAGYGTFGDDGVGLFPSWRRFLEVIREEEPEWEYFGKWHGLFETTFLERDVFDLLYERMTRLLDRCPEERYLVHGNYGFGNVLAKDGKITAVLDWLDAAYGDFLYDIAWLDFWAVSADWAAIFRDHYAVQGVEVSDYAERLRCYQYYTGMNALRFFAKAGDEDAYRWTRDRVLSFLV